MAPDSLLEDLLAVLVERFGMARTLGEVYATTYALRAYREGKTLTLADISTHTGVSKQNLSRWLQVHVDTDHVDAKPLEKDGRMQALSVRDLEYACRHLLPVAEILGCEVDPDWRSRRDGVTSAQSNSPKGPKDPRDRSA